MVKNMWNTFETCKEDLWKSNYKISDASCSKNALKQIIDNLGGKLRLVISGASSLDKTVAEAFNNLKFSL